jgi:hypothetical protein
VAVPVAGAAQHSETGVRETPPLMGKYVSIDRGELAQRLLNTAAALPNVTVHYQHKLTGVDLQQRTATFAVTVAAASTDADEITQVSIWQSRPMYMYNCKACMRSFSFNGVSQTRR